MSQVPDPAPSPERLAQKRQLAAKMQEALEALTPAERTAIVMRHWEGCGIEEIAAVLKSNTSATKNTVFRAVQKLRQGAGAVCGRAQRGQGGGNGIMKHPRKKN